MQKISMCLLCKKTFTYTWRNDRNRKYCSEACRRDGMSNRFKCSQLKIVCKQCHKEFYISPSIKNRMFCSAKCRYKFPHASSLYIYMNEKEKTDHLKKLFFKHVIKTETGCWKWEGRTDKDGYPRMSFNNSSIRGHRASYIIHNGKIPKGLWVLHRCDNPICTNPSHLFLGTAADNNNDKIKKGRNNPIYGERSHYARLSENDVLEIRELLVVPNMSQSAIAKKFNTTQATIWRIKEGVTWQRLKKTSK